MGEGLKHFERLMMAGPCLIVCAICGLLIVQRMIASDLAPLPGFAGLAFLIGTLWFAMNPPHPLFPIVAAIAIVALMASFPFAEAELEKREMREYDLERLERAYAALFQKPDNHSACFEVAKWLHHHGFRTDARLIAEATLASLGTKRDEVKNMSLRDAFRAEEAMLRKWAAEPPVPEPAQAHVCPGCRTNNAPGLILCSGCGRPFHLDKAKLARVGEHVYAKLLIAYLVIGGLIVGGGGIGLALDGAIRFVAIGGAVLAAGLVLGWLFRPRQAVRV